MNHRPAGARRRRLTTLLVGLSLAGSVFASPISALGATAPARAAAAVTVPAADLLDVDFAGASATVDPVDHSPAARPATKIGTPVYGTDAKLNRSLPSFNDDAGPGQAAIPAGADADGYTYNIADAYAAGKIQDGFTFECDFRTDADAATTGENEVCGDKYTGGFGFYISPGTMQLNATVYDGTAYYLASSLVKPNTWYSAVETWDGTTLSLYLDGVLMATKAVSTLTAPTVARQVVMVGGSPLSATAPNFRGQVTMAGTRLWSSVLSADQVAAAASTAEVTRTISGMSASDGAPAAQPTLPAGRTWPAGVRKPNVLDVNFADGTAVDTVTGSAGTVARTTGSTTPALVTDAALGQTVAKLDGTNGYAFATDAWTTKAWNLDNQIVRGNAVSVECTFKVDASVAATHNSYPCGEIYSGGAGFVTAAYGAGATTTTLSGRVGFPGYTNVSASIKTDTWYDAIVTWDGDNVLLYLNGKLAGLSNKTGSRISRPTYDFLTVGGSAKSATSLNTTDLNSLWGSVAAERVWTQSLTESEIAGLYTLSGIASDEPGSGGSEVTVPKADVLDVDLLHGDTGDHANGTTPKVFGAPVRGWEDDLKHSTVTFDGAKDGLSYDFSEYWNPAHQPNVSTSFTVECYFRSNGTAATTQKTCSGEQTGGISIAVPANSSNTVQAEAYINGGYKAVTASMTPNAWNHVVFSFNGSAEKLYVNGVLKGFTSVSGRVSPPGGLGFNLGSDIAASWPTAESFSKSSIAIARVWSSALTDAQVKRLYEKDTTRATTPAADVLDVDFHDGTYVDNSPNKLAPDDYGTPQIVTDPTLDRPVASFAGDGSAQVYDLTPMWDNTHTPNITKSFSIQCDFRYDGTLPTAAEQDVCSGKQTGGYSVNVNGSAVRIRTCVGDGGTSCPILTAPIKAGVWYALVATWDSAANDYRLYLNGQLVSAGTLTGEGDTPVSNPMGWGLGADVNGSGQPETPAPVSIAEARIWSTALAAEQVSALYQQDFGDAHTDISLTSSTPAEGAKITKATELQVKIENKDQATGWRYEIDGTAVQPGSTIGGGLSAGQHLLTITATDAFGVPVSFAVPFTSSNIPAGTATDTGQGSGKVTLSAVATSPKGGDVTTTFKVAAAAVADGGETGAIPSVPSTLDFAATSTKALSGSQDFDDQAVDSISSHGLLPYQKFEVAVPDGGARHVRWAGTVDPERAVTLYAWDTVDLSWTEIATARGTASGDTSLEGAVRDSMVDTTVTVAAPNLGAVHLLVVASDPFADDLSPRDGSNANEEFKDPSSYDFSFVHWTDPQYVAEGAAGGAGYYPSSPVYQTAQGDNAMRETPEEQKLWAAAYNGAAQWTVANAEKRKIAYTSNTGDIINNNLVDPAAPANLARYGPAKAGDSNKLGVPYSEQKDEIDRENLFARGSFQKLWGFKGADGKGLVSQVVAGNHDNRNGADTVTSSTSPTDPAAQSTTADDFYNQSFSATDYYAQAQNWPAGASYHTIDEVTDSSGNVVSAGKDNQDNYVLFTAGGQDFVAVGLSYGVTKAEADWASSIFERYHDRNGILISHGYLSASTNADGRTAGKSSDGSRLYSKVVTPNPNVFLVLAGHVHGVGTNLIQVKDKTATISHRTVELLADYQEYQMPASKIFTKDRCESAGLTDVYDPATGTGSKCKELGNGTLDVNGDGIADHHDSDSLRFGASFLRLLQFNLANSTMSVESYSPFFGEYGAASYDSPSKRYNGSEDAFTIPVDLQTRKTSFSTDGIAVLTPSDEVIGSATAKSGLAATVTWKGLTAGRTYAWTASSVDSDGDDAGSAEQFGGLFVASKAGTDTAPPVLTVPAAKTITVGDEFDPRVGATASDEGDGDVTDRIVVTGGVDTSTPGTYPLLYAVADDNGNVAQAQRVVTVKAVPEVEKTATTVTVASQKVTFGVDSTLKATVGPKSTAGTVVFNNGEDPICEATVVDGTASCVTQNFGGIGGEAYVADATFYPEDVDHFEMSSASFALTIEQAPTPATPAPVKRHAGKPTFKVVKAATSRKKGTAKIAVSPAADGRVRITLTRGRSHRTVMVTLKAGRATVSLPKLRKGTWKVRLNYQGSSHFFSSASSTTVKVRK